MYNANVTCAVLLSFVRTASIRDIDDFCKHKQIQLGVELDAIRKLLTARGIDLTISRPPSAAPRPTSGNKSRPQSGAPSSRKGTTTAAAAVVPTTPMFTPEQDPDGQLAVAVAKKGVFEHQLEIVTAASKIVKGAIAAMPLSLRLQRVQTYRTALYCRAECANRVGGLGGRERSAA